MNDDCSAQIIALESWQIILHQFVLYALTPALAVHGGGMVSNFCLLHLRNQLSLGQAEPETVTSALYVVVTTVQITY